MAKTQTTGYNSSFTTLDFFKTSKIQLVGYFLIGLVFVVICRIPYIVNLLHLTPPTADQLREGNQYLWDQLDLPDVSAQIAWFLFGCIVYLLLWAGAVIAIDSYNDIVISTAFTHPQSFHKSSYWYVVVGRLLVRAVALIVFLATIYMTYKVLVPHWYGMLRPTNHTDTLLAGFANAVIVILAIGSILYFCTILLRIATLKRRVFNYTKLDV